MKPSPTLLRELLEAADGSNIHTVRNLEVAYKGNCRLSERGKTKSVQVRALRMAKKTEIQIRLFLKEVVKLRSKP